MIAWLSKIWCVLTHIPEYVLTALVWFVDAILLAIGAAAAAVLFLLPNMPDLPSTPSQVVTVAGWVAWFFPVSTVVDILTFLIAAWLIWQGVSIILRWARAVA